MRVRLETLLCLNKRCGKSRVMHRSDGADTVGADAAVEIEHEHVVEGVVLVAIRVEPLLRYVRDAKNGRHAAVKREDERVGEICTGGGLTPLRPRA